MRETLSDHIMLSNIPYQDLTLGQTVSIERVVTQREIILFAETSGDLNPIHLDSEYAANTVFGQPIAQVCSAGHLYRLPLPCIYPAQVVFIAASQ